MSFNFKDLSFEQILKVIIGLLLMGLVYVYQDAKTDRVAAEVKYDSGMARKDLEIKILNQKHTDYVEEQSRKYDRLEDKVETSTATQPNTQQQ